MLNPMISHKLQFCLIILQMRQTKFKEPNSMSMPPPNLSIIGDIWV